MEQTLNIENINLLIAYLEKIPEKNFDMTDWIKTPVNHSFYPDGPIMEGYHYYFTHLDSVDDCGTVGCIAGHAIIMMSKMEGFKSDDLFYSDEFEARTPRTIAREFLGLTFDQASDLFMPKGSVVAAEKVKPAHAVRMLKALLETRQIDWVKTVPEVCYFCGQVS